jgi:hypothetical protein
MGITLMDMRRLESNDPEVDPYGTPVLTTQEE